jgi:membrane protein
MKLPFQKQPSHLTSFVTALKAENEKVNASMRIGSLSFAAMLSMFPALLAFSAVAQKVFADSPSFRRTVTESTWANLPVLNETLKGQIKTPELGVGALVSLVILIWSASSVFKNLRNLLIKLWGNERQRPKTNFVINAAVGILATVVFGLSFALSAILQAIVVANHFPGSYLIAAVLGAVLIGLCLEMAFYILFSKPGWRAYVPAAAICAILFTLLQMFGTQFVAHQLRTMTPKYGTIAVFLTLAVWVNLHITVVVWSLVFTRSHYDYAHPQ